MSKYLICNSFIKTYRNTHTKGLVPKLGKERSALFEFYLLYVESELCKKWRATLNVIINNCNLVCFISKRIGHVSNTVLSKSDRSPSQFLIPYNPQFSRHKQKAVRFVHDD